MQKEVLKEPTYVEELLTLFRSNLGKEELLEKISDYHESDIADAMEQMTPEEKAEMMHQALNCDYFLASCNAISEDGILVNIDGNANRVAAISYGPENVLMIVGMNKIVRSAEDAYARAKYVAAPINGQRFEGLPCAKTGVCSNCKSPKSICCQTLITRFSHVPNRIKVILVNEELGF